jgi:hypothetical protein
MVHDPDFPSAHVAISWAIRRLRTPICQSPSIYRMARKTSGIEYCVGCSPWEKIVEANYILKAIQKVLTPLECAILQTYFTGGYERGEEIAGWVSKSLSRDKWFTFDIVRGWAMERPRHTTKWWGKKYGVGSSTISRWQIEIIDKLDIALESAMTGAQQALQDSGHVAE